MSPRLQRGALATLAALLIGLASCSRPEPFAMHDISGLMPSLQFSMSDDNGHAVTADNYHGKLVLLYFGYTHCPDVCPVELATLSAALRRLGPQADRIRVLFVSVDPQRDTSDVLHRYVGFFGPQFVGLRGDDAALTALTKRYRIAYHREPADRNGEYAVDHSSAVFVFDARGNVRLLGGSDDKPPAIAHDLSLLLGASSRSTAACGACLHEEHERQQRQEHHSAQFAGIEVAEQPGGRFMLK